MHKIDRVEMLEKYRVDLSFADGTRCVVDLSGLAGRGVFAAWNEYPEFRKVFIGDGGDLMWPSGIELCPDALYLKLTGKRLEEAFPALRHELIHA